MLQIIGVFTQLKYWNIQLGVSVTLLVSRFTHKKLCEKYIEYLKNVFDFTVGVWY